MSAYVYVSVCVSGRKHKDRLVYCISVLQCIRENVKPL